MERPGIIKMMDIVRKDFREDRNNMLIGFIISENDIPEKNLEIGEVYVVYLANNDYVTTERLVDVYEYIVEKK